MPLLDLIPGRCGSYQLPLAVDHATRTYICIYVSVNVIHFTAQISRVEALLG